MNDPANSTTRPALPLRDTGPLRADLLSDHDHLTERDFPLARPSEAFDAQHRPVRGDLAHIRCAGRIFVPHYAVPMPHRVVGDAVPLLRAGHSDAEALTTLTPGEVFNVLDMAGGWAWGQQGEHGFVGYVPLAALLAV